MPGVVLRVAVSRYQRRLRRPLVTPRATLVEREGFILTLTDAEGRVGRGEAAPIYWIDDESLDVAAAGLHGLGDELTVPGAMLDMTEAGLTAWREKTIESLVPSVRAAIDTALLDLTARRAGVSAAALLGANNAVRVPINALVVESSPDDVAAAVRARVACGYETVKLKVGAASLGHDVERIEAAREAVRGSATLRLDANAAWSFDVARELLTEIGNADLDYVEEPLAAPDLRSLAQLRQMTNVPIAVDESLERLGGIDALAQVHCCDAVVLKPARVGGPTRTVEMGRRLLAHGLRVVLTDAIETAVGCTAVVHAAAALFASTGVEAIGLGGLELLETDLRTEGRDDIAGATALVAYGPGLEVAVFRGVVLR